MQTSHPAKSPSPAYHRVSQNLWRNESSGNYYAFAKRDGKTVRKSLKTDDAKLAKHRLREHLKALDSVTSHGGGKMTFAAASERWLAATSHTVKESTQKRRKTCLKALTPFFAGKPLRSIAAAHCERWKTKRGDTIAPQTFAHELNTMRAVFNYAREQGLILSNPSQSIKRKRMVSRRVKVPSQTQFAEMVAMIRQSDGRPSSQASARDGADLVELMAYSGCRLGEALELRWEHVTWPRGSEQGSVLVTGGERGTKNHETRLVPMTEALFGLLSRIHTEREPLPRDLIVKIASAKKCLATACRKLGFPNFTHHTMRHMFATVCIESGVDFHTISVWMGHKDGGTLLAKTYAHLRQQYSFAQIKRVQFAPTCDAAPTRQGGTVTASTKAVLPGVRTADTLNKVAAIES